MVIYARRLYSIRPTMLKQQTFCEAYNLSPQDFLICSDPRSPALYVIANC